MPETPESETLPFTYPATPPTYVYALKGFDAFNFDVSQIAFYIPDDTADVGTASDSNFTGDNWVLHDSLRLADDSSCVILTRKYDSVD